MDMANVPYILPMYLARNPHMSRTSVLFRAALLAGVLVVAGTAFSAPASSVDPTIGRIAGQLGVHVAAYPDEDFTLGRSFTGTLQEPSKLAALGIPGMSVGARVVAARIAIDKVVVEADQLDPPKRTSARLSLDGAGKLARPPKV